MNKVGYSLLFVFSLFIGIFNASASVYNPTVNSFENSYSNNLIDMAQSQVDNFINKKYVFFQVDTSYYLVVCDNDKYLVNGNIISMTDTTIFRAYRSSTSGSYTYIYATSNESSTTVNANYTILSNIDSPKSVSSKRFSDYWSDSYNVLITMIIFGLVFAMFLSNGRSY